MSASVSDPTPPPTATDAAASTAPADASRNTEAPAPSATATATATSATSDDAKEPAPAAAEAAAADKPSSVASAEPSKQQAPAASSTSAEAAAAAVAADKPGQPAPASTAVVQDEECTLFLGDLARSVTEDILREHFSQHGTVVLAEIKRDRITHNSLSYGFVQMSTRAEAAAAKRALHKTMLNNRAIRIGWAQKNTNLFIGDLDPEVTSEELRAAFRVYGPIFEEETFVKHRNYGFVRFRRRADAERAKKEMEGKPLGSGSRPIRIGWGDANTQKHCVHIQFDPALGKELNLTDTVVREAFSKFGKVVSVNLPQDAAGAFRGFGFVHYDDDDSGEAAATTAISALNSSEVAGVKLACNFGKRPSSKNKSASKSAAPIQAYPMQVVVPVQGEHGPQWQLQYVMPQSGAAPPGPGVYPVPGRATPSKGAAAAGPAGSTAAGAGGSSGDVPVAVAGPGQRSVNTGGGNGGGGGRRRGGRAKHRNRGQQQGMPDASAAVPVFMYPVTGPDGTQYSQPVYLPPGAYPAPTNAPRISKSGAASNTLQKAAHAQPFVPRNMPPLSVPMMPMPMPVPTQPVVRNTAGGDTTQRKPGAAAAAAASAASQPQPQAQQEQQQPAAKSASKSAGAASSTDAAPAKSG